MQTILKKFHKKIKDLPPIQRPREKLSQVGVSNLTNAELLAIIMGSGIKGKSVLKISDQILKKFTLSRLDKIKSKQLMQIHGIGQIQAMKIKAAIELGKRASQKQTLIKIDNPEKVFLAVREISHKKQEHTMALYLNARQELIKKKIIAVGNFNSNIIEAREVFGPALTLPASFVILAHNHPSGDINPSQEDIEVTQKLTESATILGINLIDHLIVSQNQYHSFKGKNFL
jgi:DNA repair protein RadC